MQEYRDTIDETERRVERLTEQLRQHTPAWRWAPVVDAYQVGPRSGRHMLYRQGALPKPIWDIAWKAQLCLTSRFRKLVARGKAKPKVATAFGRELTGFIWAIRPGGATAGRVSTRRSGPRALAKQLRSSQSRKAKMEAADTSVSLDLMMRSLLGIGATPRDTAKLIRKAEAA